MKFWLQYALLKVVVLDVLLVATVVFALRYPAMWTGTHMSRFPVPTELFTVTRLVLPALLAFGWFTYVVAAKRIGRPQ